MIKYLLLKLAEEAGEVVVAAIKHRLHRTDATRRELALEVGDLQAIVDLLLMQGTISPKVASDRRNERYARELKRAKDR
jgi:phosphoribosyl-ATP pyrophosphohydrolase